MGETVYLKQMELGPMQNFVYLIGDPETRECVVVDRAWEIRDHSRWADGMKRRPARTHTLRITWAGSVRLESRRAELLARCSQGLRAQSGA